MDPSSSTSVTVAVPAQVSSGTAPKATPTGIANSAKWSKWAGYGLLGLLFLALLALVIYLWVRNSQLERQLANAAIGSPILPIGPQMGPYGPPQGPPLAPPPSAPCSTPQDCQSTGGVCTNGQCTPNTCSAVASCAAVSKDTCGWCFDGYEQNGYQGVAVPPGTTCGNYVDDPRMCSFVERRMQNR